MGRGLKCVQYSPFYTLKNIGDIKLIEMKVEKHSSFPNRGFVISPKIYSKEKTSKFLVSSNR